MEFIFGSKKHHDAPLPGVPPAPHHPGSHPHPLPGYTKYEYSTQTGHRTLWVVFVLMTLASLTFMGMSFRQTAKRRLFHHITAAITTIAAISYLAMATGLGRSFIEHKHVAREVFWARDLDWLLTTPLLVLDLALLAGVSTADTLLIMAADVAMIVTGLISTLVSRDEKWVFFAVSCLFLLYILYGLLVQGRSAASARSDKIRSTYNGLALMTVVLWSAYPVVFAITEGKHLISPDVEIILYAVLDVLAKAGFGFWLLTAHSAEPGDDLGGYPDSWVSGPAGQGYGTISRDGA